MPLGPIYIQFPLKFPLFKLLLLLFFEEFPLLLNGKWEFKWEFLEKYNLNQQRLLSRNMIIFTVVKM